MRPVLYTVLLMLFCIPYQAMAQPKVIVENPVFTFDPVPEGVHIPHEFVIKNSGDTLLTLTHVRPP